MQRTRSLPWVVLTAAVAAWSLPAFATGNCANGKAIYNKKVSGIEISCSQASCHGAGVNNNNIRNASGNPGLIDQYLDSQSEMAGLRSTLALTESDIDDLATWIFFAPSCPAASPILQAAPAPVAFASTTVGSTSAITTVTISNVGTAAATGVSFANSNATEFLVSGNTCSTTINAGASCSLGIAFKPSAAGVRSGTLTVNRSGGAGVGIGLSGTGTATVTPGQLTMTSSLAFGSQTVGTTSSASTVTVTNVGGSTVAWRASPAATRRNSRLPARVAPASPRARAA